MTVGVGEGPRQDEGLCTAASHGGLQLASRKGTADEGHTPSVSRQLEMDCSLIPWPLTGCDCSRHVRDSGILRRADRCSGARGPCVGMHRGVCMRVCAWGCTRGYVGSAWGCTRGYMGCVRGCAWGYMGCAWGCPGGVHRVCTQWVYTWPVCLEQS